MITALEGPQVNPTHDTNDATASQIAALMSPVYSRLLRAYSTPNLNLGFSLYSQPAASEILLIHAVLDEVLRDLEAITKTRRPVTSATSIEDEPLVPALLDCLGEFNNLHPWILRTADMTLQHRFESAVKLLTQVLIAVTNNTADGWLILQDLLWLQRMPR